MKNSAKYFICLLILMLTACGKAPMEPTLASLHTKISLTIVAKVTEDAPTATPSVVATPEPTHTIEPTVFVFPTPAPTKLPEDVKASLTVETLEPFDGHTLRRISGWSRGFDGFTWIDSEHLFIYPIIRKSFGDGEPKGNNAWFSYPTVLNLNSGKVWLPPTMLHQPLSRSSHLFLPKSLSQAPRLLASDTDTATMIYNLEGDLLKTYPGQLSGVSPSGSKILVVDNHLAPPNMKTKWIDLLNNKEVVFDWQIFQGLEGGFQPMWSSDEMKVYVTTGQGNFYGNAKTGESYMVPYGPFEGDDKNHLISPIYHSYGTWVLNDTYVLARWNEWYEGAPGYISFFDPAKKAYRNLSALLGLPYLLQVGVQPDTPYLCENGQPNAQQGGRYVWVNCQDGGRLIDMQTFKAKTFPYDPKAILEWSADGNFAFFRNPYNDGPLQILSAARNELKPISYRSQYETWHPKQNIFACLFTYNTEQMLLFFDAHSMLVKQQFNLPTTFRHLIWNESGSKLILTAGDESLWQIDYPALSHLEQLTGPIPGMGSFALSPDGASIAFYAGQDIYIVDTMRKP